jgi:hypothetical protein
LMCVLAKVFREAYLYDQEQLHMIPPTGVERPKAWNQAPVSFFIKSGRRKISPMLYYLDDSFLSLI